MVVVVVVVVVVVAVVVMVVVVVVVVVGYLEVTHPKRSDQQTQERSIATNQNNRLLRVWGPRRCIISNL